jgi:hypothetical protein
VFLFLITSIPATFIGGLLTLIDKVYSILLILALTFVAIRLLFFRRHYVDGQHLRPVPSGWSLAIGLGIGGGIFLSPIILFARWGSSKQASDVAASYIAINTINW